MRTRPSLGSAGHISIETLRMSRRSMARNMRPSARRRLRTRLQTTKAQAAQNRRPARRRLRTNARKPNARSRRSRRRRGPPRLRAYDIRTRRRGGPFRPPSTDPHRSQQVALVKQALEARVAAKAEQFDYESAMGDL